jgi:hypothetical protein
MNRQDELAHATGELEGPETIRPEEDDGHFHACRGCRDPVQCWCSHPDDDSEVYCAECEE